MRWDDAALADPHVQPDKAQRVEAMFDAIAPTYERVNSVLSLGRDAAWRRRLVNAADLRTGDVVLDVACGTGDLVRAFALCTPTPRRVIGLDFAAGMLACGRYDRPGAPISLLRADALNLPLADETVNVISCAFGVRNFQNLDRGLHEMHRVLRPGGRLVILEFTVPQSALMRWAYRLYCKHVMPRLGRWISRDKTGAYDYLPQSVATFDSHGSFAERLRRVGFETATVHTMNLGTVALHRAEKRPT